MQAIHATGPDIAQTATRLPGEPLAPGLCLIVEDSAFDQKMMRRAVDHSGSGFEVAIAASLTEARRVLAARTVALVLLDNTLPDGRGADFAMELADNPGLRDVPVLIVSDWPSPFMWKKAEAAGVRSVISKSDFGASMLRDLFAHFPPAPRRPI